MLYDTIIAGSGLAGACAALVLSRTERVLLLEAERPAAGASGAAAGLVNPFMGRKAKPTWRMNEALAALHDLMDEAGAANLFRGGGLLRPARSPKQAGFFRDTAVAHPDAAEWLSPGALSERAPAARGPHGGLWVRRGGAVDTAALVKAFLRAAERRGATVRTGVRVAEWSEKAQSAHVVARGGERIAARRVLLTLGQGYPAFPELKALDLHGVKGQTIRVRRPEAVPNTLPPLSGFGYVVPEPAPAEAGGEALILGSSYDHDFADLAPSPAVSKALIAKAAKMLPALGGGADVLEARAGVRVKRRGANRPLLGPLPGRTRVWTFTGLGSRGLLTAPLLARDLPRFFAEPEAIPAALRPAASVTNS